MRNRGHCTLNRVTIAGQSCLLANLLNKNRELLHGLLSAFSEFHPYLLWKTAGLNPLLFQLVVCLVELDHQFKHLPGQRRSDIYGLCRRCALRTLSDSLRLLFPHDLSLTVAVLFLYRFLLPTCHHPAGGLAGANHRYSGRILLIYGYKNKILT